MDLAAVMQELERRGSASAKRVMARHGLPENSFGVKVADLKTILKRTKQDHALALALWDTGNADAMYLAGLMADAQRMAKQDLERWAKTATWQMLREYSVAGVAADSPHGPELARQWIDAQSAEVRSVGWATWSGVVAVRPDAELDLAELERNLARVEREIGGEAERVRYTMNGFVIGVGSYVEPLAKRATQAAKKIGRVEVDLSGTACKVPDAAAHIAKIASLGRTGKKRATARC
ncbi:MAG: DNA alkylation repair protein [Planctomycetes bacterium]|nr:DNA alkylation repair protein [Planctomycetota bacterium]